MGELEMVTTKHFEFSTRKAATICFYRACSWIRWPYYQHVRMSVLDSKHSVRYNVCIDAANLWQEPQPHLRGSTMIRAQLCVAFAITRHTLAIHLQHTASPKALSMLWNGLGALFVRLGTVCTKVKLASSRASMLRQDCRTSANG